MRVAYAIPCRHCDWCTHNSTVVIITGYVALLFSLAMMPFGDCVHHPRHAHGAYSAAKAASFVQPLLLGSFCSKRKRSLLSAIDVAENDRGQTNCVSPPLKDKLWQTTLPQSPGLEQKTKPRKIFTSTQQERMVAAIKIPLKSKILKLKKRKIQWVSWAGSRGMLPYQHYYGSLTYEEYRHWLRTSFCLPRAVTSPVIAEDTDPMKTSQTSTNVSQQQIIETITQSYTQLKPPEIKPKHIQPIYIDDHIIVVNKNSGVLSVPGPRRHECVASLAYRYFGKSSVNHEEKENDETNERTKERTNGNHVVWQPLTNADNKEIDTMIVHRLDRDTSGVFLMARNIQALKQLHSDFKDKTRGRVDKRYVALVCGHWNANSLDTGVIGSTGKVGEESVCPPFATDEGEIDLPLVRDMERPPFMRVATIQIEEQQLQQKQQKQQRLQAKADDLPSPSNTSRINSKEESETHQKKVENNENQQRQHSSFLRMVGKAAKPSLTTFRILSYEYLIDNTDNDNEYDLCHDINNTSPSPQKLQRLPRLLPVTRVELQPITGRTHQLRVHCAAVGHPIVGDSIYGYNGEGSPCGGLAVFEDSLEVHRNNQSDVCKQNDFKRECYPDKINKGASLDLQRNIYNYWMRRLQQQSVKVNSGASEETYCMLCLHAQQLTIFHPYTKAPMAFESPPPF